MADLNLKIKSFIEIINSQMFHSGDWAAINFARRMSTNSLMRSSDAVDQLNGSIPAELHARIEHRFWESRTPFGSLRICDRAFSVYLCALSGWGGGLGSV